MGSPSPIHDLSPGGTESLLSVLAETFNQGKVQSRLTLAVVALVTDSPRLPEEDREQTGIEYVAGSSWACCSIRLLQASESLQRQRGCVHKLEMGPSHVHTPHACACMAHTQHMPHMMHAHMEHLHV